MDPSSSHALGSLWRRSAITSILEVQSPPLLVCNFLRFYCAINRKNRVSIVKFDKKNNGAALSVSIRPIA